MFHMLKQHCILILAWIINHNYMPFVIMSIKMFFQMMNHKKPRMVMAITSITELTRIAPFSMVGQIHKYYFRKSSSALHTKSNHIETSVSTCIGIEDTVNDIPHSFIFLPSRNKWPVLLKERMITLMEDEGEELQ